MGYNKEMIEQIAKYLTENNFTLSIAESCTGGLISSMFTDISGASKFIKQNFVTYSNDAKVRLLGVNPHIIDDCGVVSEQVARDMARGTVEKYGADFGLSTTGKLDGEGAGEVYVGFAMRKGGTKVLHYISPKVGRIPVKQDIAACAIDFLWERLNANPH